MTIHVVQPGETLYGIAGQYGVDPELLRVSNGVPEDGVLAVGQALAETGCDVRLAAAPRSCPGEEYRLEGALCRR